MKKSLKIKTFIFLSFITIVGTYNAVVINSESLLDNAQVKSIKRLDEILGNEIEGKKVVAQVSWQKLSNKEVAATKTVIAKKENTKDDYVASPAEAEVQQSLDLNLVEAINPKKWTTALGTDKVSGNLVANNGTIESFSVTLPNSANINLSSLKIEGNVFEYDIDGSTYSAMMYQVDQKSYMVTLTNGPLEGTRLRFNSDTTGMNEQSTEEFLAEKHNVEIGSFGEESNSAPVEVAADTNAVQPQGFNFSI